MYEIFYGLRAEPFRLSPDHRFCYEHSAYSKARAYMAYALRRAEGFVMITGRPGTGKTTLIGELVEGLADDNVTAANLVCTQLEADDLLKTVAYSFGVGSAGLDKAELLQRITVLLNRWHREKRRALLVVDEAQDLSISAMEELRLLTNIQVGGQPLLQIFLLGQPELRDLILSPQLEQVHQRIVAASHLEGLAADETEAYVVHRLQVVGWNGDPAIDRRIFPLIHKFSEGVPRRINLICSRLFLLGSVEERHEISVGDVRVVIAELQAESLAAGSAFSDEEFHAQGDADWLVGVPAPDNEPQAEAAAVHLRAVSNESFKPVAPADEAPANAGNLAPVTPLKQPEPVRAPEVVETAAVETAAVEAPVDAAAVEVAATGAAAPPVRAESPNVAPRGYDREPESFPEPEQEPSWSSGEAPFPADELPPRVAAGVGRAGAVPPVRSPWRPLLVLGTLLALGVSLLFFLELYVSRDDGWDDVLAGEVIPAAPAATPQPDEPIEELGVLPSEQWERDGKLIDWERDVERRDAASAPGAAAGQSDAAPVTAAPDAPAMEEEEAAAPVRDAELAGQAPVAAAEQPEAMPSGSPATESDEAAAPAISSEESEQLLALLSREAAATTYSVTFGFDSTALNDQARDTLAQVITRLQTEPRQTAEITGFADYQGDERYNLQLSIERARAVRDYLVEAGVRKDRLIVSGRGAQPVKGGGDSDADRELRIVQLRIIDNAD